jgi:hypothetical protein
MHRVARGRDPGLAEQDFIVSEAEVSDGLAPDDNLSQGGRGNLAGKYRKLHDDPNLADMQAETRHGSDHSFSAHRRGFDGSAVSHNDEHGNHSRQGEICLLNLSLGFIQQLTLRKLDRGEAWKQKLIIGMWKGGQQLVAERPRIGG